jgi:cytochrome c oxidase subunit 2
MTAWGQLAFQDASSPVITQIIAFHDHAALIILLVVSFVGTMLVGLSIRKNTCRKFLEAGQLEIIWTVVPAVILIFLALPSLRLLYLIDEVTAPKVALKRIAHQWYWTYRYNDTYHLTFNSYIIPTEDLTPGQLRLLEVDHRAVIPVRQEVRLLVSSADVIHSLALPSLGIKIDAIPGRLNQVGLTALFPGVYYGQCSEICGANHSFMPIAIEAVNPSTWISWLKKFSRYCPIYTIKS